MTLVNVLKRFPALFLHYWLSCLSKRAFTTQKLEKYYLVDQKETYPDKLTDSRRHIAVVWYVMMMSLKHLLH